MLGIDLKSIKSLTFTADFSSDTLTRLSPDDTTLVYRWLFSDVPHTRFYKVYIAGPGVCGISLSTF